MDVKPDRPPDGNTGQMPVWPIWIFGLVLVFPGWLASFYLQLKAQQDKQPSGYIRQNYRKMRNIYTPVWAVLLLAGAILVTQSATNNSTPNSSVIPSSYSTPAYTVPPTVAATATSTPSIMQQEQALCEQQYGGTFNTPVDYDGATATCVATLDGGGVTATFNTAGVFADPCADFAWTTKYDVPWSTGCGAPPESANLAQTDCNNMTYFPTPAESSAEGFDVNYYPFTSNPSTPHFNWYPLLDVCTASLNSGS